MKPIVFLLVTAVGLVMDQLSKIVVLRNFDLHQSVKVIPGFFDLTLIYNYGVAFGFMGNWQAGIRIVVITAISILALTFILRMYLKEYRTNFLLSGALALILAGALGNIIDRVRLGAVVDFIDIYIGSSHWPAFNFADSYICVGVFTLIIFGSRKRPSTPVD